MLQKVTNTSYYGVISAIKKMNITGNAVMTDKETSQITTEISNMNAEASPENTRRNFIKKFGKLATVTPIVLTTLMTPAMSNPIKSDGHPSCDNGQSKHCPDAPSAF
ncbi:MAG: hypothetical protein P8M49_10315 [Thalassotalea sp.]|nr:hypothetical protein [Thalassotalea sp.]